MGCQKSRFAKNSAQKVFWPHQDGKAVLESKGRRFQRQSLWSRPAGREILCFHKDQEGRRNSPMGCCVVGNPIKGFPDAASHAAFVHLDICQPVFRHAETPDERQVSVLGKRKGMREAEISSYLFMVYPANGNPPAFRSFYNPARLIVRFCSPNDQNRYLYVCRSIYNRCLF